MNNRAVTLSIAMAVMAVFFVQSYVTSVEEDAKKKYGTEVLVIVARKDIKEMETVNETMLEYKLIPKRYLEPASVSADKKEEDKETTKTLKALAGTVAIVPIKKGEQITYNKLTDPSLKTGLSPQVTPGRRAISIPVTDVTGVSKLVKPGDRVDLIAILDLGTGNKTSKIAKTVLQDVIVLSIGRYVTNNTARTVEWDAFTNKERIRPLTEDYSFTTVTLEVEPIQAQTMALIMANGDNALTLALRNNDDTERTQFGATLFSDILGPDAERLRGGQPRR